MIGKLVKVGVVFGAGVAAAVLWSGSVEPMQRLRNLRHGFGPVRDDESDLAALRSLLERRWPGQWREMFDQARAKGPAAVKKFKEELARAEMDARGEGSWGSK